jgi:hypothetical protein
MQSIRVVCARGTRHGRAIASVALAAVLAACGESNPVSPNSGGAQNLVPVAAAEHVARGIAAALASAEIRKSVRDAMRASPWDGHKLVLQDFLETPAGEALWTAARRASGRSAGELDAALAALPSMDFYMPVRTHRRTWTGDARVMVVAASDRPDHVLGFTPEGGVVPVSRRSAEGLPPLLFLEPAELKGRRVNPQAATPGLVIEDENDGLGSEVFVWQPVSGAPVVIDMAEPDAKRKLAALWARLAAKSGTSIARGGLVPQMNTDDCDDPMTDENECPPPPSNWPPDTTRVDFFEHYNCDNGYCWTDAEFRIDARHYSPSGVLLGMGSLYRGSLEPGVRYQWNASLIANRIRQGSGEFMDMNLTEQDRNDTFGVNKDDDCGSRRITQGENGFPILYSNTSSCAGGVDEGYFGGYVADITYGWTPKF